MTISAKVIADSISPTGNRITTFELEYPRFIHVEFLKTRNRYDALPDRYRFGRTVKSGYKQNRRVR